MILDDMEIDSSSVTARSSIPPLSLIEDPEILTAFAQSLYDFKQNAENTDLFSIVKTFREIATGEVLKQVDPESGVNEDKEVVENWILETKFWNLVEILIGFRSSDEYDESSSIQIDEFTSQVVIKNYILMNNSRLRELDFISYWLIHNLNLDEDDEELNPDDLQSTKWLNTKIDLQSNSKRPDLVSTLDADATLRNNKVNKRSRKINEKDMKNDQDFFKMVFKLLLEEKHDEILELCESTNNWTLSSIMAGAHDYVDPEIDSSILKGADEDESMEIENAKATGIKNKLLWRRTVYLLSMNPNLSKYERAVYSYLSGDYLSIELISSWERQLLILSNNILQHDLEAKLTNHLDPLIYGRILKLSKPEKKFSSINEVLNFLSQSSNQSVKKQSSHSIRVLIGAIITNNVDHLITNSINLLDELILANDKIRNNSSLTVRNTNNLIKESYLLRILIHFIIFMKFLNDNIISDENLVKLIKLYITRLSLYKLYDLIPIYISYIPSHSEVIENYSFFLSNIIIDKEDRLSQLKNMRTLGLPLEDVLKRTVERIFEDTAEYYKQNESIELNGESVSKLDLKLIGSISWFLDSNMLSECVRSTIALARRFLSNGKLHSLIKLFNSFDLSKLVNEYKVESDIMQDYYKQTKEEEAPSTQVNIEEISQYQVLIRALVMIDEYDENSYTHSSLQLGLKALDSIYPLITSWLSNLISSTTGNDTAFYEAMKSLYLPYLILKALNIIKTNQSKELLKEFKKLVLVISNEEYKIYSIFMNTDDLKEVLQLIADISTNLFNDLDKGIYD